MTIAIETRRRRRAPEEVKAEAIAAARRLLAAEGPAAVTLQAVAAELGMAHGNITHHFRSAANLQAMLADKMVGDILKAVRSAVEHLRAGTLDERDLVDMVFDAFETTGVARLLGWLAAQQSPHLDALYVRLGGLAQELGAGDPAGTWVAADDLPAIVCDVVLAALGGGLIGTRLSPALGLPADYPRQQAAAQLAARRKL